MGPGREFCTIYNSLMSLSSYFSPSGTEWAVVLRAAQVCTNSKARRTGGMKVPARQWQAIGRP